MGTETLTRCGLISIEIEEVNESLRGQSRGWIALWHVLL